MPLNVVGAYQSSFQHSAFRIHHSRAFTLVETLATLALSGLLLSLCGQIAVRAWHGKLDADARFTRMERDAILVDTLRNDVDQVTYGLTEQTSAIRLFGKPDTVLELDVLAAMNEPGSLHLARRPATVRYRLLRDGKGGQEGVFVREIIDRTDPAALPAAQVIAREIASFEVGVWARDRWRESFPVSESARNHARGLRVTWTWGNGHSLTGTLALSYAN